MRVLAFLVILMSCLSGGYASTPALPPDPTAVATLDLSSLFPSRQVDLQRTSIAFVSETSMAVVLCSKGKPDQCQLSLIRWETGVLQPFAQTPGLNTWAHVNPATDGRVLMTCYSFCEPVLYSADLSISRHLPEPIHVVSPSGGKVATITIGGEKPTTRGFKPTHGSWKVYRVSSTLEPIRDGTGKLLAISDDVVVIQDGTTLRTETLAGKLLGSFSVQLGFSCPNQVEPLGDNRLYLNDCKSLRIVDFNGNQQLKLQPPKGWGYTWFGTNMFPRSADGSRMLFDYKSRDVSVLRNIVVATVGLATLLEVDLSQCCNRQEIRVVDTVTGASCFEWRQSFPMGSNPFAAPSISPSGEFLAIVREKTLSIYHLPAVCGAKKLSPSSTLE